MMKIIIAFICSFASIYAEDEMAQFINSRSEREIIKTIIIGPFAQNESSSEAIELRSGIEVTDQSFQEIGKLYPALQILMVSGNNITDAGLTALATGCPDLRLVSIDPRFINWNHDQSPEMMQGQVTDSGVEKLAMSCPHLQSVTIAGHNITDAAVVALAKHCPDLESLYAQNGQLTDQSLFALAEHSKKLFTINVADNPGITFAGVKALIENENALQTVAISHTSVSKEEYLKLCEMRPDIHFFH